MEQTIALWSMVKLHGLMVADSSNSPVSTRSEGRAVAEPRGSNRVTLSNVVAVQPSWMARPVTKAPETQIYFITHGSGAFPVPRVRTVVRGERASRSIVNRTTALWSIWMVASLILAGSTYLPLYTIVWCREIVESRRSNGVHDHASAVFNRPRWTLPLTNGRKRT